MKIPHWKNAAAILTGCVIAVLIFEVFLRIYNPIHFTVRGDNVTLPTNVTLKLEINRPNMEKLVTVRRNALGFRGTEMPVNLGNYLSIITVGGSTTECIYIPEGKTWTDLLADKLRKNFVPLWVNNAGYGGHSTFGHNILIQNYISKIKPKVVLFLVGINDVNRAEPVDNSREPELQKQ
jgi:hypothetical protein